MLDALEEYLDPPQLVILRGESEAVREWQRICRESYRPNRLAFAIPADAALPGILATRDVPARGARAWLCAGTHCLPAASTEDELRHALSN